MRVSTNTTGIRTRRRFSAGPTSATLDRHWNGAVPTLHGSWFSCRWAGGTRVFINGYHWYLTPRPLFTWLPEAWKNSSAGDCASGRPRWGRRCSQTPQPPNLSALLLPAKDKGRRGIGGRATPPRTTITVYCPGVRLSCRGGRAIAALSPSPDIECPPCGP